MFKKKLNVIELNKKEEKIVLEESSSKFVIFFRKHGKLLFITALIISLTILVTGGILFIKNMQKSNNIKIDLVEVSTTLKDNSIISVNGIVPITSETAKKSFMNSNNISSGEVITVKTLENDNYILKFYSDYTALKIMKNNNHVTKIYSIDDKKYGISDDGVINANAKVSDISVSNTKENSYGTVTYFSDGSADIVSNDGIDIYVRDANDIKDNYISNNKVSYLKESKKVGSSILNYYEDGTIEVEKDNKKYIIRHDEDIKISNNEITFINNNQASLLKNKKMDDGYTIEYYTDGGAIIKKDNESISVRKSNSIIIKDNKIYEIVDNIYVETSYSNNNVTYYTNGSAVVNYNGLQYIDDNSNIKYKDNKINKIDGNIEKIVNETNINNENVKMFEETAVIKTDEYIAIIPKDNVLFDSDGLIKELLNNGIDMSDDNNEFTITNNEDRLVKYRVVLEKSDRTNLDTKYIKYQLLAKNEYIESTFLNDKIWKQDNLSKKLNLKKENYILIDSTIEPYDTININLMLWTDYETIPNAMQNKYFYGTIKVYAWVEE